MRSPRLRASIIWLWFLVPWVGIAIGARRPIRDNSFLWHVEAGRLQAREGRVLTVDPFSFAFEGSPWRTQSWLLELMYQWLESLTELRWVPAYLIVVGALLFVLTAISAHGTGASPLAAAVVNVGLIWLALPLLVPRPVVVSFALLALWSIILRHDRLAWAAPLIMWVWASVHGSFVLGIGLLLLDGLRRRSIAPVKTVVASSAAASLTAHGFGIWTVVLEFLGARDSLALIAEWAPPDLLHPARLPFVALIAVLFVGATRGSVSQLDLWVVVPVTVFGLTSTRALVPAAIILLPWVATATAELLGERFHPARSLVVSTAALVLGVLPLLLPVQGSGTLDPARFPVGFEFALAEVATFHDDVVGGYLMYRGEAVLVDDRAEFYSAEFLRDVVAARNGTPQWRSFFEEFGIRQALLRTSDGLAPLLAEEGWIVVMEDEEFVLLRPAS